MNHAIKITLRSAVIEGAVLAGLIALGSGVLPEAFDIDNAETARLAGVMLMILAPKALFICLSRVTAIFYQYTQRI
jgi:type IV secretory pathway TrbL component